jgi:hypothetical protein
VTGVDISPEHIRQAAGNVPDAEFICSEAIVSLYTFDHIPRDDNDEPGIVAEWLGADMYFSMFGADATRQLVRDTGFDIEETALGTQTEGDIAISYTWILARKPSSAI